VAHDVSEVAEPPKATTIPCLGCGKRDGLISPIKGKKAVLYCMRCGTLIDTEGEPIDAIVPQLVVHTLSALGVAAPTTEQQKFFDDTARTESQDDSEQQPENAPPPAG
jgi:hypothetical protein